MAAAHHSLLGPGRSLSWPFVAFSVSGHVLFFVLMLGFLERPKTQNTLAQKPIRASLVRLGKPRDPTLLPRIETPPPPPPASASPPSPSPVPPAVPPVSVPSSQIAAKPPAPQASSSKAANTSASLFSAFSREARPAHNDTAPQGEIDGDPMGDSAIQEGERYLGLLSMGVRRHYDVSSAIPENQRARLEALVFFRIAANGKLIESKLSKSSGNLLFDSAVESAVRRAAPFSPPPEHLKEKLRKDGVVLKFSP